MLGKDYELGPDYRGIYGLYGSYDYIAPQTFACRARRLSLGTTGQWWTSKDIALQGTALLGVGYAAVGTTHSTADNDYHYGVAPQALLALRVIFGDRVSLDLTGREYFVSDVAAANRGGHDNIVRTDASLTFRVYRQHAISLKYLGIAGTPSIRISATAVKAGRRWASSTPGSARTVSAPSSGADPRRRSRPAARFRDRRRAVVTLRWERRAHAPLQSQ